MYRADTIVARATAPGRAAIAIVRISGRDAFPVADRILEPLRAPRPWRLQRATARDPDSGAPLDDVLAVRMPGPRTYTGEDMVEIHCHGGPVVVDTIIDAALRAGARPAERGEFTRRAVLNGRMDLLQAEAVSDLIDARVAGGARLAWQQLQGALSQRLAELRELLLGVLADVEANVDFSDDELPEENNRARADVVEQVRARIAAMLGGFAAARRWREGYRVVFAGRPNVGKSSLVNALLGHGRMIVSDEPGTTRDSVEEVVDLGGTAFVLTDTAGIRASASRAEEAAVERARSHARDADVLLVVLDGSAPLEQEDRRVLDELGGQAALVLLNKGDLDPVLGEADVRPLLRGATEILRVSARTGEGCEELAARLVALATRKTDATGAEPGLSRARHRSALERAQESLGAALELLGGDGAAELVAFELRAALDALASITDPVDNEDVLDRIFADFCIGK